MPVAMRSSRRSGHYRQAMRRFAAMRTIDVWYARLDVEQQFARWSQRVGTAQRKRLDKAVEKARQKDSLRALTKLTHQVDGEPRIVSEPPLLVPIDELLPPSEAPLAQERLLEYLTLIRKDAAT